VTELSDDELERYARHIVLPQVGGVGQRRLKAAKVVVVGAGGIGSAAIPALAGAGMGRLTIIDDDDVDRSNLQRQWLFRDDQVGESKAELAAGFARSINPRIEVRAVPERVDATNADELLAGHDLIVDGSDNFATRLAVSDCSHRLRIPLVSAAAAQFQGQVGLFRGWEASQPCYRCFVGDAFDNDDCDNCAERGVFGAVSAIAGSFAALLTIRQIADIGDEGAGKLFLFDGLSLNFKPIRIPKDGACKTCGGSDAQGS
jgi:molybdopterin/thiamine biosynthesis adenylyltransferase